MATKAIWLVNFIDGTSVEVRASSRRNAHNQACAQTGKALREISTYGVKSGRPHNGKRSRSSHSGRGHSSSGSPRSAYKGQVSY